MATIVAGITLAEARRYAIEEVEIANVGRRKPQDADTSARQSRSEVAGIRSCKKIHGVLRAYGHDLMSCFAHIWLFI